MGSIPSSLEPSLPMPVHAVGLSVPRAVILILEKANQSQGWDAKPGVHGNCSRDSPVSEGMPSSRDLALGWAATNKQPMTRHDNAN